MKQHKIGLFVLMLLDYVKPMCWVTLTNPKNGFCIKTWVVYSNHNHLVQI